MKKAFCTILTVLLISSLSFAELKLKLHSDLAAYNTESTLQNNIESKLKLNISPNIVPPSDSKEFSKGMMLLGILADVSFPMGSDTGFAHIAGTAWSAHLEFSYFASPMFRLTFRGGYINFGAQTDEGTYYNYEDTFSQIPILVGGYYMFNTGSGFKPYLGLALGVFFQTYEVNWQYDDGFFQYSLDESFSNTAFGIVPGLGAYYMAASVLIQLAVEYTYVFSDYPIDDEYVDEDVDLESPSYFSVLLGLSIPVGK